MYLSQILRSSQPHLSSTSKEDVCKDCDVSPSFLFLLSAILLYQWALTFCLCVCCHHTRSVIHFPSPCQFSGFHAHSHLFPLPSKECGLPGWSWLGAMRWQLEGRGPAPGLCPCLGGIAELHSLSFGAGGGHGSPRESYDVRSLCCRRNLKSSTWT